MGYNHLSYLYDEEPEINIPKVEFWDIMAYALKRSQIQTGMKNMVAFSCSSLGFGHFLQ